MDWKVLFSTFITVFLAELGDKTQLAAMAFGAKESSTFSVALGVISALSVAGLIGVLAGKWVSSHIDPKTVQDLAALAFIAIGAWILWQNRS